MVTDALLRQWNATLPGHSELGGRLLTAWADPARVYHGVGHLQACLTAWARLGGQHRNEALALWFHDLVHHNQPGIDERASAEVAAVELDAAGLGHREVAEVVRLILATINHRPAADDQAAGRVCDADLAILGAEPRRYLASVAALRAEFCQLTDAEWRATRRRQVETLRARESLFTTRMGRDFWEAAARQNLRQEWDRLSDQGSNGDGSPAP